MLSGIAARSHYLSISISFPVWICLLYFIAVVNNIASYFNIDGMYAYACPPSSPPPHPLLKFQMTAKHVHEANYWPHPRYIHSNYWQLAVSKNVAVLAQIVSKNVAVLAQIESSTIIIIWCLVFAAVSWNCCSRQGISFFTFLNKIKHHVVFVNVF